MIRLKNVSKIYYQNGTIATGFSKVSTKFDIGEFIVIVGESGSGKSTLLNVISGLDTYEEGEMYINGEETSHYTDSDFEDYRRKYVANIFQAFNLVNSYTVKQNVELVLLIHGFDKKTIKNKVTAILKKVGLYELRNRRVSRLSGGQKQKTAIARALAKETPIIVADEPTGNLDKEAAREIFKLLSEIAKDKLVVVVTHNFDQVEKYATRVLKMHDGRLIEDKKIKDVEKGELVNNSYREMNFMYKLMLAMRNAVNVGTKFLIVLAIFLIISFVLIYRTYGIFQDEYDTLTNGSQVFVDRSPERIVLNKKDKKSFSDEEMNSILNLEHVSSIDKYDSKEMQMNLKIPKNDVDFNVGINTLSNTDFKLIHGRKPEKRGEILLTVNDNAWNLSYAKEYMLNEEASLNYKYNYNEFIKFKIVGIAIFNSEEKKDFEVAVNDEYFQELINYYNFLVKIPKEDITIDKFPYSIIVPTDKLKAGEILYDASLQEYCEDQICLGKTIKLTSKDLYFSKVKEYVLDNPVDNQKLKELGINFDNSLDVPYLVYVSFDDIYDLVYDGHYQISAYVDDVQYIDEVLGELDSLGYNTLALKDTVSVSSSSMKLFRLMNVISIVVTIIVLVAVSSVVINLVLRSRIKYFAVVRMLGGSLKLNRTLINLELAFIATLSYVSVIFVYVFNHFKPIFNFDIFRFVKYYHLIIIYGLVIILALVISRRFSKKIFNSSMINTYNMEV